MTPKEGEILFVQLGPDQIIPTKAENKNALRLTPHRRQGQEVSNLWLDLQLFVNIHKRRQQ